MRGIKKLVTGGAVAALLTAGMAVSSQPAQAASGGGCTPTSASPTLGPCISYASNYISSDFYFNVAPDSARCKYRHQIYRNGSVTYDSGLKTLIGKGRYGPERQNVDKLPNQAQNAYTRVTIYKCDNTYHYAVNSPTVYFTA
ncbi:hypothetical protein SAZ11_36960 [Streptomyces sp. FXJ1.4098]|uniref:hypothetical protein n=1 Tax=Streptomyces sp. NPDC020845 TaxID=3365096 RepID=UPI0029935765|nr:hypothetical protein [Streptomyces sp. FXJ1.4098]